MNLNMKEATKLKRSIKAIKIEREEFVYKNITAPVNNLRDKLFEVHNDEISKFNIQIKELERKLIQIETYDTKII